MNSFMVIVALVAGAALIFGGAKSFTTTRRSAVLVRRFMRYEKMYITGLVSDIFSALRILTGMFFLGSVIAAWVGFIDYEAIFFVLILPFLIYVFVSSLAGLIQ